MFSDLALIPTRLFPAHSQVVLVSPLLPDDLNVLIQLRARGYQLMVVSPDPVAHELEQAGRSVTLISRGYGVRRGQQNDEARELALRLPDVPHLQNADRIARALAAAVTSSGR